MIFVVERTQPGESCSTHEILTDIQSHHPARIVTLHQLQVVSDASPVTRVAGAPEREGDNFLCPPSPLTSLTTHPQLAGIVTALRFQDI